MTVATPLPDPPTPAECDLRDFPFTPIFRARLFGSSFHARANDAEWRAGFTLWLKSWDQVPAGSLPDDDVDLCRLAELGRDQKSWRKVKTMALHGWIKCSDGRLYHGVVAQGVAEAWDKRSTAKKKGVAGASKRWGTGNAPAIQTDSTSNSTSIKNDSSGNATATVIHGKGSGSGSGSGRDRDLKPGSVGVTPTDSAPDPLPDGHFAVKNTGGSTASPMKTIVEAWNATPQSIAATAATVGCPRHEGEPFNDWQDRIYSAVEERKRQSQLEAVRKLQSATQTH